MSPTALHAILPLADWSNFYVIIGTSAGALTGLTFVVITISGDPVRAESAATRLTGLRAFITPTAVHFGVALWISALLCIPRQTVLSAAICVGAPSVAGIVYTARVLRLITAMRPNYRPFVADWAWNIVLPTLSYLSLLAAAFLMTPYPPLSLDIVAFATLLLLTIGIHNAWDVVVWFTTERHAHPDRDTRSGARTAHHPNAERAARVSDQSRRD
ncbi:MAG TPA: hypothetical protein VGI35_09855 [Steroidobacteraceae bacterium]|jgi:hypothetical protein